MVQELKEKLKAANKKITELEKIEKQYKKVKTLVLVFMLLAWLTVFFLAL